MIDFAALPPEVNSGRMYAGAGVGPMITAASAWDEMASELNSAAASYQSVVSSLSSGSWLGSASESMAAAAAPYVEWMNTTATQAQQTAAQARSAASAYEAAFAATVPPAMVAANRSLLALLVATNLLGQNTAAIAANEAEYGEMWAQDASAMYGYAGASAAAAQLTPFSAAPDTTNPAASGTQAGAATSSASASAVSSASGTGGIAQLLLNFLNSPFIQNFETLSNLGAGYLGGVSGLTYSASGVGFVVSPFVSAGLIPAAAAAQALYAAPVAAAPASAVSGGALGAGLAEAGSAATGSGSAGLVGAEVSAGLGRAASVGGLSVPQAWGTAAPEIRLAAKSLPMASAQGLPEVATGGPTGLAGGMPAMGPIGSVVNAPRSGEPARRLGVRGKTVASTEDDRSEPQNKWANFDEFGPESQAPKSEREELLSLRRSIAALTKERDVLKRSATLLINQAMEH
jgi:PPE-repeat protein